MKKKVIFVILSIISNFYISQTHLVLEGGGIRGIAYLGALQYLEENNLSKNIEGIAGTSVGAIISSLICVGYTSEELKIICSELNFRKFNDNKGMLIGGLRRIKNNYGWYKGEKLEKWLNNLYYKKTGIKNITLEQLQNLQKEGNAIAFTATATDLSQQKSILINALNFPDMDLARAVRISAGIPGYFQAIFMDSCGNTFMKPKKRTNYSILIDGGFLNNYPIHCFDGDSLNSGVIGLRLERTDQIINDQTQFTPALAPFRINSPRNYIEALYNLNIESLNRSGMTSEDWKRTVSINTCDIGPRIKPLKQQEIDLLINSGYAATKKYYETTAEKTSQP